MEEKAPPHQKKPATRDATPAASPAMSPAPFSGHHDHSYTLQMIMELQKSMGKLEATIDNMNQAVHSTKSKVDDLVNWKNRILGGAFVIGAVVAALTFFITKFSDYVTLTPPAKPAITQPLQK